ncbi:glycosyltransferase [Hathewaya histolytica]|uniref:glycosyltransferase n=1 Tax=Hathewaya histolytica TaxID=1498 RepID=UPI003B675C64
MKNLTVIVINDFGFINGGAEKVAIESAIELKKRGLNVVFFCGTKPIADRLIELDIKIVCTNQEDILNGKNKFKLGIQGVWNTKAYNLLNKTLKDYDVNNTIIHIHSWQKTLSASVISCCIKNHFKMVMTLHSYCISCPNGGLYNYNKDKICDIKPLSLKCIVKNCDSRHYFHKVWRVIRSFTQKYICKVPKNVSNYIYISNYGRDILKEYLPKDSKFYNVKNPVDILKKDRVRSENNDVYLYIGRLSKEKGVLLLAEVANTINRKIIFIGDGDCKDEIKKIYPEAEITGWLTKDQIERYLEISRALIFPSLWYEGMPLTVLESKSKGVPVILSDKCNACEVIENKIEGLWFKRGDRLDLINKINKLDNDNNLVQFLSRNCYKNYWHNDYGMSTHIEMLLQCYKDIIEN